LCATPVAYGGKPHNSLFQTRFGDEPCRAAQESHDFNRGRCQSFTHDVMRIMPYEYLVEGKKNSLFIVPAESFELMYESDESRKW
jgi:hypothetical protein